jgi:hypothetical protein
VKDQHSTTGDDSGAADEPDDAEVTRFDVDQFLKSLQEDIASERLDTESPWLITVDELRAAGALDVPAAWRKSLGEDRDLFSAANGDDENPENQQPAKVDPDE